MLELAGFTPTMCSSAEAALEELREQPFDLVLTDYMLPRRTGGWLLEQAVTEGLIDDTPVLVVTAHSHPADVEGYEVIPKPFDLDHLVWKVRQHLESPTRRPQIAAPTTSRRAGDGHDDQCPTPVELILYVSERSERTAQAVRTIERVIARFSSGQVILTIHDLSIDPATRIADAVAYTPTLLRRSAGPRTFILGHITSLEIVAHLLKGCGVVTV
jgi:DNA-binding response OmpR family regulator